MLLSIVETSMTAFRLWLVSEVEPRSMTAFRLYSMTACEKAVKVTVNAKTNIKQHRLIYLVFKMVLQK
jgi:hypothetical protein